MALPAAGPTLAGMAPLAAPAMALAAPAGNNQTLDNYGTISITPAAGESADETWRRLFGQVRGGVV